LPANKKCQRFLKFGNTAAFLKKTPYLCGVAAIGHNRMCALWFHELAGSAVVAGTSQPQREQNGSDILSISAKSLPIWPEPG
jgi:hypothetical protein